MDSVASIRFTGDTANLSKAIADAKAAVGTFGSNARDALGAIDLSSLTSAFKGAGDQAEKTGEQSGGALDRIKSAVETATLGIGALAAAASAYLVGVGIAATSLGNQVRAAAGAFDQTSATIGALKAVADASGVGLDALGKSFLDLQKKARTGDDEIVTALRAIGVTAGEVGNLSHDALAARMAEAFATAKDSSNKAAAAVALFGSEAAGKLVPQLDQGAAHIRDLAAAADRAGTVIGPELAGQLAGTRAMLQASRSAMQELRMTIDGGVLEAFATFKPAIDGLIQGFNDLVRNVTSLTEWLFGLDGAARKATDATGFLADGARLFSRAMVEATVYVEELAVRGVRSLNGLGIAFGDLASVAGAFGQDVAAIGTRSATALHDAFHAAIDGIAAEFRDLGAIASQAMNFDFSGMRTAFAALGSDAAAATARVKAALGTDIFAGTTAAMARMTADAGREASALDKVIARLEAQKKATLDLIAAGGAKGPTPGTRAVGDPEFHAPDEKAARDKAEAALAALDGEIAVVRKGLAQKEELYSRDVDLKVLSEREKLDRVKTAQDEEYTTEKALLQKKLDVDGITLQKKAETVAKLKELDQRYAAESQKTYGEMVQAIVAPMHKLVDDMASSLSSSTMALIERTGTIRDLFRNLAQSVTGYFVKMGADVVADWAKRQLSLAVLSVTRESKQTAATAAGEAARTGIVQGGVLAQGAARVESVIGSILASANETIAGVTGFLSPILGPAAIGVGEAAGATVSALASGLPSFAVGHMRLPSDMIAQLHAGEMIVPASPAAALRDLMSGGGLQQGGGGDTHVYLNVSTENAQSFERYMHSEGGLRKLSMALRRYSQNNPSTR